MPASLLLAALLFPLQAGTTAAWRTVVSEDGRYSVEMPAAPNMRDNRTRGGSDGSAKITVRGYQGTGGKYYVQKTEFPPNLIQGTEDGQLDSERNEIARQYGGKPTGEKKITLEGGSRGREFMVRGRPKGELGIVTVRVREYLVGKTIYAVLAASVADKELPGDADRFLGSLKIIGGSVARAKAAPAPAPAARPSRAAGPEAARRGNPDAAGGVGATASARGERPMERWGTVNDPDGDCKIYAKGKTLVMEVPKAPHALIANPWTRVNKPNAPRVTRDVEGDFEVQVRVDGNFEPNGDDPRPAFAAEVRAGLVLFLNEDSFIMLDRSAVQRKGRVNAGVGISAHVPGKGRNIRSPKLGGQGPTYLRLARKGSQIMLSTRGEGDNWISIEPIDVPLPDRVKVGLVATSSSIEPFTVTFDEFSFKGD